MRRPDAAELLTLWEAGEDRSPISRAVLLATAETDLDVAEVVKLPIGRRDAAVFRLRASLFGSNMDCLAHCPKCGGVLETRLSTDQITGQFDEAAAAGVPLEEVAAEGYEVVFRLPSTEDLLKLETSGAGDAESDLLAVCILEARAGEKAVGADALPEPVRRAVGERMGNADPCADVQLELECPSCAHRWRAAFDIVSHLWSEIDVWARRLLVDVHVLASAYGWREHDILALTDARRRAYLEFVDA